MSERERDVYYLLTKARDIAYNAADLEVASRVNNILLYMDGRSESERTGRPERRCANCGMAWYSDCDQFGCWSCGHTKMEDI